MTECCEYCGTDDRYGHTAVCVMNEVIELRADNERLRTIDAARFKLFQARNEEIKQLCARDYELRAGLHVARGALLGIGTEYSKEVAEHLAGVLDPSLSNGERTQQNEGK